jgi:hypothetical protein
MSVRTCKTPTDWTLLALQSERSGRAHYVMVCRCPDSAQFEGPYTHNHPPYARVPGIRVYGTYLLFLIKLREKKLFNKYLFCLGMLCNQGGRKGRTKTIDDKGISLMNVVLKNFCLKQRVYNDVLNVF